MKREHVHLIGIGGTGMAALAGLLAESGCRVTGSDRELYPPTSTILEGLGLDVRRGYATANLDPAPDLVVVGNAISRGNPELEELLDRDLSYTSMPRLLCERFLRSRHSIVVAGTHGKTTTASMLAWVLHHAGRDPGFLIGGMPCNFDRPFSVGTGPAFVVEGDEYDTAFFDKGPKFMHYRPDTVLLGTIEFDHADIYPDLPTIQTAFRRLVGLVPRRGVVAAHVGSAATREVVERAPCRVQGYALTDAEWTATNIVHRPDGARFELRRDGRPWATTHMPVGGEHNVLNALAVTAAAAEQGLAGAEVALALATFGGVRRRLELRGVAAGVTVLDDFAHHPTAIRATLEAVRQRWPDSRVWAVLEPRSWSLRRNVFQDRLAESFDAADEVVIAGVYEPEKIPAPERLDPARLAREVAARGPGARTLCDAASIVEFLADATRSGDIVTVMSNGGFDGLHERLLQVLEAGRGAATGGRTGAG